MQLLRTLQTWVMARAAVREDNERGAAMVEYGLLVAVIAVITAVGAGFLGVGIDASSTRSRPSCNRRWVGLRSPPRAREDLTTGCPDATPPRRAGCGAGTPWRP